MAHQDRAVTQRRELLLQSRLPARVVGIGFVGHARVADFVVRPEFSLKAVDELVVPFIMRALAAALNEQHLMWHPVSSSAPLTAEPLRNRGRRRLLQERRCPQSTVPVLLRHAARSPLPGWLSGESGSETTHSTAVNGPEGRAHHR